jgi:hypothetical protein
MAAPAPNPANVLVGPAYMYTAVGNTALVANTLAYNTIWPSPWVYAGATAEGVSFTANPSTNDINIEEQPNPALVTVNSVDYQIAATLQEDLMAQVLLSLGHGALTTVAAASGIPGTSEWNPNVTLNQYAVGFEGINTFGFWRRFYFALAVSTSQVTTPYRRAAAPRQWATTFRAICPPAGVRIVSMTAAALP